MQKNTFKELKDILKYLEHEEFTDEQLSNAISKCSFSKMKAQENCTDSRKRHARKGIIGDWKNNFNEKSVQFSNENFIDMMIEMGYEPDRDGQYISFDNGSISNAR